MSENNEEAVWAVQVLMHIGEGWVPTGFVDGAVYRDYGDAQRVWLTMSERQRQSKAIVGLLECRYVVQHFVLR